MNPPASSVLLLCDECIWGSLVSALRAHAPRLYILQVGDLGAPAKGTLDPDLLAAAEAMGRIFLSRDRQTMPKHLRNHYAAGRHTAGVILLRRGFSIGRYVQEILHQLATKRPDEWMDNTIYLPL